MRVPESSSGKRSVHLVFDVISDRDCGVPQGRAWVASDQVLISDSASQTQLLPSSHGRK